MLSRIGDRLVGYDISGEHGDWVCLAHPHCSNRHTWTEIIAPLAQNHRVLSFDIRGHGETTATPPPYTMSQLAQDAAELLAAFDIASSHWIGQAMGAMVGQRLAIDKPELIKSLVLSSSTAGRPDVALPLWHARNALARQGGLAALQESTLQRWFTPETRHQRPELMDRVTNMMLATPVDGYVGASLAMATMDLDETIGQISCPTLILVGASDSATPPSEARRLHAKIKGSRLIVLPNSAHMAHLEQPDQFKQLVLEFLAYLG